MEHESEGGPIYNVTQAAHYLGLSRQRVHTLIKERRLMADQIVASRSQFFRSTLDCYLAEPKRRPGRKPR